MFAEGAGAGFGIVVFAVTDSPLPVLAVILTAIEPSALVDVESVSVAARGLPPGTGTLVDMLVAESVAP